MKTHRLFHLFSAALLGLSMLSVQAQDSFGSGANTFTIDFVEIGNAGNGNDTTGFGGVGYDYRISTTEISQNHITTASNAGLSNVTADAHAGNRPAADISWYEAAAFVNWMNTSKGHQAAYNLTYSSSWSMSLWGTSDQATTGVTTGTNPFRHKDAIYFLPGEDEWYKAAYHQNDGVTGNYWDYATGSNLAPSVVASGIGANEAVYGGQAGPAEVTQAGGLSEYGTMGQNGNMWEWNESTFAVGNTTATQDRIVRGGHWLDSSGALVPTYRAFNFAPDQESVGVGFRVAAIPEPSAILLALSALSASLIPFHWMKK